MSMQGIDISEKSPKDILKRIDRFDFVIVKTTQGSSFTNPFYKNQCDKTLSNVKKLAVYHHIDGTGALKEVNSFISTFMRYKGLAIPVFKWCDKSNIAWGNENYLDQVIYNFIQLVGIPPIIYCNRFNDYPWKTSKRYDCGVWVFTFSDDIESTPNIVAITQNILPEKNNFCGMDIAYMEPHQWNLYANPKETTRKYVQPLKEDKKSSNKTKKKSSTSKSNKKVNKTKSSKKTKEILRLSSETFYVYSGPGTSYDPIFKKVDGGSIVKVLEIQKVSKDIWVRIKPGWIQICKNGQWKATRLK